MNKEKQSTFRSGFVALIGRPNVGKSTLLNQLIGQKIAATTHKPQTTRKNLLGILHPEGAQIMLLDTPGHHQAKGALNRYMVDQVRRAIGDADLVAYVVEARVDDKITDGNERILDAIVKSAKKVVLVFNKIDLIKSKDKMLSQIQIYSERLGDKLVAVVPVSATQKNGLDRIVEALAKALPEGPRYYEDGQMTDMSERGIVAEMIREKVMLETQQELPYSAATTVEEFEDLRPKIVKIIATIHVERDSQKGMVIGKGGARIKAIGQRARQDIEYFLGSKVFLDLKVRVTSKWSDDTRRLADFGYSSKGQPISAELSAELGLSSRNEDEE
jgi:GTP-binding protein Era